MAFDDEKLSADKLDSQKLGKLKIRISLMERENHATRKLRDNEMVEKIIKEITREVNNDN
jgi:hypothetical protein